MKNIKFIFLILLSLYIIACGTENSDYNNSGDTGSITVKAKWPDSKQISYNLESIHRVAPAGVVKVRMIVSGPDMSDMQKDFTASLGKGTIHGVSVGDNRMVTLQGLDSNGSLIYEGAAPNLTISANQTTDTGIIKMISVTETPLAPQNVSVIGGNSQLTISWDMVSEAVIYNVYMATSTGVSKASYSQTNITTSTFYTWTGLTNDTTYYFVVTAENSYGESDISTEVSATPKDYPTLILDDSTRTLDNSVFGP